MATSRPSRFPRVPYSSIRQLVGWEHVSATDERIEGLITFRMKRAGARPAEVREAVRYALDVHHENQDLFRRVVGGRL
jgi:hypothetical protein